MCRCSSASPGVVRVSNTTQKEPVTSEARTILPKNVFSEGYTIGEVLPVRMTMEDYVSLLRCNEQCFIHFLFRLRILLSSFPTHIFSPKGHVKKNRVHAWR